MFQRDRERWKKKPKRGRQRNSARIPWEKEQPNQSKTGPDPQLTSSLNLQWPGPKLIWTNMQHMHRNTVAHQEKKRHGEGSTCANTNTWQPNSQQTKILGFNNMAEEMLWHACCDRQANESVNKSATNTEVQVVVFQRVKLLHVNTHTVLMAQDPQAVGWSDNSLFRLDKTRQLVRNKWENLKIWCVDNRTPMWGKWNLNYYKDLQSSNMCNRQGKAQLLCNVSF